MQRKKNARRIWKSEEESQLREMAKAGKSVTMIALRLKRTVTAVRGRSSLLGVSLRGRPEQAADFLCRADSVDDVARKCEELGLKPKFQA
jgi:hypothetical protein